MNENCIEKYVDANGKVIIRQYSDRLLTLVFAGTKFTLDRVLALLGLIILSPLMLILSIIIKLESKGPVFFKQTRTGKGGKNITIYKFRTMKEDNDVHDFTTKDELTRVGKILRKTSLDELPQLISILTGDMSFIGPRPWIPDYFENMNEIQRHRYCIRPGLTGLAQANGRNAITIFDKIKYDLEYIENYSFSQDIKVIFLTVKAVFSAQGVDAGKGGIEKDINDLKKYNKIKVQKRKEATNDDLVSIVVPVYNAEKFIAETIESVLAQTYKNWELILVNDCSKDNSKKIIKKYCKSDERIKLVNNKVNSRAAISRNNGIKRAKGRYICFLDADDLWDKYKLEKQLEFIENKNCTFSFTGYEFADENGKPNGKKVYVPDKISYKQALKNTTIWTSTVMFDMNKLRKNDIYMPDVTRGQDTATWWKVLKKIDYAYGLNEVLSFYRRSSGTLSSNKLVALKRTWNLYRNIEHLSFVSSIYNFCFYCFNAVKRRL